MAAAVILINDMAIVLSLTALSFVRREFFLPSGFALLQPLPSKVLGRHWVLSFSELC